MVIKNSVSNCLMNLYTETRLITSKLMTTRSSVSLAVYNTTNLTFSVSRNSLKFTTFDFFHINSKGWRKQHAQFRSVYTRQIAIYSNCTLLI